MHTKAPLILLLLHTGFVAWAITVTSWNVGLEEQWADQRTPAILAALNQTEPPADVLCLIEVWGGPARIRQFVQALNSTYPYHATLVDDQYVSAPTTPPANYAPACATGADQAAAARLWLLVGKCIGQAAAATGADDASARSDRALACAVSALQTETAVFQRGPCWSCLLELGYKIYSRQIVSAANALTWCLTDRTQPWVQTLGLVLLSRTPLAHVRTGLYTTWAVPRGYIQASVMHNSNNNQTTLVCTHLTVPNLPVPYLPHATTPYASWAEENLGETRELVHALTAAGMPQPLVVAGDFNHGPALAASNISAVNANAYQLLAQQVPGMEDVYVTDVRDQQPPVSQLDACTCCPDNTVSPTTPAVIYDHVWVRWAGAQTAQRVYDAKVWIADGQCARHVHLSDHYGLAIGAAPNRPNATTLPNTLGLPVCSAALSLTGSAALSGWVVALASWWAWRTM